MSIAGLTRRLRAGDEAAYRVFHDTFVPRLTRYLITITAGDETLMRDALQATLYRVVRHVRRFDDEGVFWSWLTVLGRTALADERRKRTRYGFFLLRFARYAVAEESTVHTPDAEPQLSQLLKQNLGRLDTDERELLAHKYDLGRTTREIADELGTTEKAVESRLARVRLKLKQMILSALKHESAT
ncbi:MAG TPA: sigma-70 family RNA polymerase sigma factor [Candidatus Synoicihabitans sp.]|nr:sigma-70 family RNA polymerase sigma factor [Candidatus Synoicihabitans sp.]